MRDFFAMIYEIEGLIFKPDFLFLFKELFLGNGYILLGLSLLFIPLLSFMLFYWDSRFPWGNPYRKKFNWFLWLVLTAAILTGVSYAIVFPALFYSSNPVLIDAMKDPATGYAVFAAGLTVKLSILNGVYSLLVGFLWSLLIKQKSVLHIHIPF